MKKPVEGDRESSVTEVTQQTVVDKTAIRKFHVNVLEAELTELRRRINATKWQDRETVGDAFIATHRPGREAMNHPTVTSSTVSRFSSEV